MSQRWAYLLFAAICVSCGGPSRSSEQTKTDFNDALIKNDGAKLHTLMKVKELNGASAEACQKFLDIVIKPIVSKMGNGSSASIRFSPSGSADIEIGNRSGKVFNVPVVFSDGEYKADIGFASLAFWSAHIKSNALGRDRIGEAEDSHAMVQSWVPEFEKAGILGSFDPDIGRYSTWKEILDSSQKEIDKIKSGGK